MGCFVVVNIIDDIFVDDFDDDTAAAVAVTVTLCSRRGAYVLGELLVVFNVQQQ